MVEKGKQIAEDGDTTKTYENENKKFIIDAITNTFYIDPNKISVKEKWGWTYISVKDNKICRFGESSRNIFIYLDKYGFEDAGLGKITKKSAEVVANNIIEKSGTNKEIHIYMEALEGLDYVKEPLYPKEKSIWKKFLKRS